MRKFIYFIIPVVLLIGAAVYYYYFYLSDGKRVVNYSENSAFKAVPVHSPLVLEVQNPGDWINTFKSENMIVEELKNAGILSGIASDLQYLESLRKSIPEFDNLSNGKPVLISLNFEGKNEIDYLFLVSLNDKREQKEILDVIKQIGNSSSLSKRNYDNAEIYRVSVDNTTFSFAFTNGIFAASKEAILVEEAVRQSSAESLLEQADFQKLYKTSNSNAFVNIFINHETIGQLLAKSLNKEVRRRIGHLASFAERTELDLTLKNDELFLSGFSFANDSSESYINLFKKQEPQRANIESVLPANTSLFLALNIENPTRFFDEYKEYSRIQGSFYDREAKLMGITKDTKTDFMKLVNELVGGEFGIAFTSISQNAPVQNRFFLMEIQSQSIAREKFELLLKKYVEINKVTDAGTWRSNYQIDEKRSFTIYHFPFPGISEVLFGKVFSGVECNCFTFFDNYVIFADSEAALKEFIHSLVLDETLSKDVNYLKFKENVSNKSNLYLYANFSKLFHLAQQYLNPERLKKWNESEESIRKFYAFSWQFSKTNDLILNSIYLKYDPAIKEEPQTVWQTKLGSNVFTKPQIVMNHRDPLNNEIIFQDTDNQLYLINKDGVTLWKVKLPEPIQSEIFQIDYYKNGKYQYLFNTKTQLILLDRNGEKVAGFPIALRSPATNGVAVIDYEKNKNYRFLIACEDKKLYAYSKEGKFVKGWKEFVTDNLVEKPIHYVRIQNKDYLVLFDRYKTYFLDRQGKAILSTNASFEHSNNDLYLEETGKQAVLCTDKTGAVYKLYFDGTFEKIATSSFSANHYFVAVDLNGNGKKDFVFADGNKLTAFSESGVKIFSKELKKPISDQPEIFAFAANNKKIGVVSSAENRIYLFNSNGTIYDGFPLYGNSGFCIGTMSKGNKYYNLFVGNEDQSFYNYMVE